MAALNKIRQKIESIVTKKGKTDVNNRITKKAAKVAPRKSRIVAGKEKKEVIGTQEMLVEKTKYYTSDAPKIKFARMMPQDLPYAYGEDKIVLQIRDPWWLYAYWEVVVDSWNKLKERLGDAFYNAKKVLRVYDVSKINFNGKNANAFFDIEVRPEADNWYINTAGPGKSWCVDYGLKLPNGEFITVVRSNIVHSPLDTPSWVTDEEWMIPEEMFARLYGMGFGLGQSSPVGKAWQERIKQALFSGVLASPGITSMSSPTRLPKQRKFWLVVDCELIVYGATEPDAKVSVQGKEIKLRPDGTFTLRYALPDGKQVIPVKAISSDEIEERVITPIVSRETQNSCLVREKI